MNFNFEIPIGTTGICIQIRHAKSEQGGDNFGRTLTGKGIELCGKVKKFYNELVNHLEKKFGKSPKFGSSEMIRSSITCWEIFHPAHIDRTGCLNVMASLKKVREGEWVKEGKEKGLSVPELVQEFCTNKDLWENQPIEETIVNYTSRILEAENNFIVDVSHEPGISLVAINDYLPKEKVGLNECEAVLFFIANGRIIGAKKFVPELN